MKIKGKSINNISGTLFFSILFSMFFLISTSYAQDAFAQSYSTKNLYTWPSSTFGYSPESFVVTVAINDADIHDTYDPKGEPDVVINGKILRMAQGTNGIWYGFFADIDTAKRADSTDLDFGVFCSGNTNTSVLGVDFSDAEGVAVPRDGGLSGYSNGIDSFAECTGSVNDSIRLNNVIPATTAIPALNTNSGIITGQIGLDNDAWPIIQLYDFTDGGTVQVQYNKGGELETMTLIHNPEPIEIPIGTDVVIAFGSSVQGCEETNECYIPYRYTINVGESVTWYNADTAADHTVTSGTTVDPPSAGVVFDSSFFMAGTSFSHTFSQAGEYPYFDLLHPWAIGKIIVQGSGSSSSDTTPTDTNTDTTPPDISLPHVIVPSDMTIDAGTADYVILDYSVIAFDHQGSEVAPTCDVETGSVISVVSVAQLLVTCTASNYDGSKGSASFMVTITSSSDSSLPQVIVPSDMTIDAGTADYVILEYYVKAIDDDGVITPTCNPSSGSIVSVGEWLVACTATDSAGNIGYNRFMVTITSSSDITPPDTTPPDTTLPDTTPPHVKTSGDMTIDAVTDDFVKLEYDVKAFDDVDGVITPTCDVGSGSVISVVSVRQLLVTCTATDSAGNTGSDSFMVTITHSSDTTLTDTTPPRVMVPSDMTIDPGTDGFAILEYDVKAIDDVDGVITPTCDVRSGTEIPLLYVTQFLVTCTATDSAGNTGGDSFMVTIISAAETGNGPIAIPITSPYPNQYISPSKWSTVMNNYVVTAQLSEIYNHETYDIINAKIQLTFFVDGTELCTVISTIDSLPSKSTEATLTWTCPVSGTPTSAEYAPLGYDMVQPDGRTYHVQYNKDGEEEITPLPTPESTYEPVPEPVEETPEPTYEFEPVPEQEHEPTGFDGITVDSSVSSQDDDLSELIDENRKLREELERHGEQIDELSQEVDFLKQIIQSIQGFFSRIFG